MRTSMPRASKSATPKWPPSTSKAMHSIQNGITPSRPVCPKIQDEVLNLPHRLSGPGFASIMRIVGLVAHPVGELGHIGVEFRPRRRIGDGFGQRVAHAQKPGVALGVADRKAHMTLAQAWM